MHIVFPFRLKTVLTSISAACLSFATLSSSAQASDKEWWFDIEVIVFSRDLTRSPVTETFEQSSLLPAASEHIDLITPYLTPDLTYVRSGLSYCRESRLLAEKEKFTRDFAFPEPVVEDLAQQQTNSLDDINSPEQNPINSPEQSPINSPEQSPINSLEPESINKLEDGPLSVSESKNQSIEQDFEYRVATDDIFSEPASEPETVIAQPSKVKSNLTGTAELNVSAPQVDSKDLTDSSELAADSVSQDENSNEPAIQYLPITVDWIEWQIPKQFPCAYAEQIEPTSDWLLKVATADETTDSISPTLKAHSNTIHSNTITEVSPLANIEQIPNELSGVEWQDKSRTPFILPKDTHRMSDLYTSIRRQRGISPLIHLAWRQQVTFGANKAQGFRLFAGQNFIQQFDALGQALPDEQDIVALDKKPEPVYIPSEELDGLSNQEIEALMAKLTPYKNAEKTEQLDIFSEIEQALLNTTVTEDLTTGQESSSQQVPDNISELWELDGFIKVYLQNVGRVPYLHINSNLDYRLPMSPTVSPVVDNPSPLNQAVLQSVNFNQLRRVISKQVHYFDHPLFGMVIRIDRYKWPEVTEQQPVEN